MSDLPESVGKPHRAARRPSRAKMPGMAIKTHGERAGSVPALPDNDSGEWGAFHEGKGLRPGGQPVKAKAPSRPAGVHPKAKAKKPVSKTVQAGREWQSLKSADIVLFNLQNEDAFVYWLAEKIAARLDGGVAVGWVIQNGAFEFGVSIETMKRYLIKHTAERAEFHSDGKVVRLR